MDKRTMHDQAGDLGEVDVYIQRPRWYESGRVCRKLDGDGVVMY